MKSLILGTLAATSLVAIAGQSLAGSVTIFQVPNCGCTDSGGGNLADTFTYELRVNASAGASIGAMQILLEAKTGQIVEHPLGTNTPPNAVFLPFFPALRHDSFLASGSAAVSGPSDVPIILGASQELGANESAAVFSPTKYDASYGPALGQMNEGATGYLAALFTFTNNASGTIRFKVDFSDGTSEGSGFGNRGVLHFPNPPEPQSVTLLGMALAGVLAVARRRLCKGRSLTHRASRFLK